MSRKFPCSSNGMLAFEQLPFSMYINVITAKGGHLAIWSASYAIPELALCLKQS